MAGVDPKLLEILVCPLCKGKLVYRKDAAELVCKADRLGDPVKDGIPAMLEEAARQLGFPDHEIVVNVQGDEPLVSPKLVADVAGLLDQLKDASVSTACHAIHDEQSLASPNVVKVVIDARGYALYFSRSRIPYP